MMLEKRYSYAKKKWNWIPILHYLHSVFTSQKLTWTKDLSVRPETINLSEENIRGKLLNIGLDNDFFFYMTFKAQMTKVEINIWDSVQFSCSVVPNSLQPHEPQHTRPPCPSPTPRVHPNPCPLTRWSHPAISSCRPLLLLPSIFPIIRVFSNKSALHIRWPMYWSFSFNLRPINEQPGLISFRMDWLDLRAVQGTLKSLLQHHSSKASILRCSAFFIVQLSHPYMTTKKP